MDYEQPRRHAVTHQNPPKLEQPAEYGKLAALLIGLVIASFGLFYVFDGQSFMNWMQFFMALFFIVFALFKFIGYEVFVMMFPTYDIIAKRHKWYAYAYPFIEIFLGFAYLTNALGSIRDIVTIVIMGVSAYGVWKQIQHKRRGGVYCACLGNVIKLPLTKISFLENATMGIMAFFMLIFG